MSEYDDLFATLDQLGQETDRLREQNTALVEALRPFAALWRSAMADQPDSKPIYGLEDVIIAVGDVKRARADIPALIEEITRLQTVLVTMQGEQTDDL